jgi:hypothetical protein
MKKLELIRHRVNQIEALSALDPALGAEIDIRSAGGRLILTHDPFTGGDDLEAYLEAFAKSRPGRLLILNTKEDGLEPRVLEFLLRYRLERFFFLDTALPTLVKLLSDRHERRAAVRYSEYEPVEFAERFAGLAEWVWVDCFRGEPAARDVLERLGKVFKICLVSPELQGYAADKIEAFRAIRGTADAVCTKYPERWV